MGRLEPKCAFCRKPLPKTDEERIEQLTKRIEANDPVAMREIGLKIYDEGDYKSAFEYWTKAAALGDVHAHYQLSCLYRDGQGVEKDVKKQIHHLEQAAIGGQPDARHNLGCIEFENDRMDRAVKHLIIAAKLGLDKSLDGLKDLYRDRCVSQEDFASALRGHKAAIDATKSPQREEVAAFEKKYYGE